MVRLSVLASTLALIVYTLLLASPQSVSAHALLVRSDPPEGAKLAAPPKRVTAWFSEPLQSGISSLRVLDGTGARADTGRVEFDPSDPTKMSVALRDDLGPGLYTVVWETLSRIDGHFRLGSFEFTILNPDGSEPKGPRPSAVSAGLRSPGGEAESALTKTAGLIATVMLVGGLAFALLVAWPASRAMPTSERDRSRVAAARFLMSLVLPSIVLLAVVAGAELVLQARQIGGLHSAGTVLGTEWGQRWIARQVFLALLALFLGLHRLLRRYDPLRSTRALWPAFLAGLGYMFMVAMVSHGAAVLKGSFWATVADFVHLLAAAVWIGGFVQLGLMMVWSRRRLSAEVRPRYLALVLQKFSLLAATTLVILLVTGVFNALVQVSTAGSLVETAYGRALIAKLALTLPLLAVVALNAVVLRPRLVEALLADQGSERLQRLLARLVAAEVALGLGVLAAVGVLVQYTPARVEVEVAAQRLTEGRGDFAYPLAVGSWGAVVAIAFLATGLLFWLWAAQGAALSRAVKGAIRWSGAGLAVVGMALLVPFAAVPVSQGSSFDADVALRYQTEAGRFVLLEIAPFQVGQNSFRVTVLDKNEKRVSVKSLTVRFSRLESDGTRDEVRAPSGAKRTAYKFDYALNDTGWWTIDAQIDEGDAVSFYLKLDDPSRAPLNFAPPDYQSDAAAEAVFRKALGRYEGLRSVQWKEELTSGLPEPITIGAWVVTDGEAAAPDKVHFRTLSPGYSRYELYRIGDRTCNKVRWFRRAPLQTAQSGLWQCQEGETESAFDLDYQEPATAFRLGKLEIVDGERAQVLFFYNPTQPAWYAWWIGQETGYLLKQVMLAPGHFMLTHFYSHDSPLVIDLPPEIQRDG